MKKFIPIISAFLFIAIFAIGAFLVIRQDPSDSTISIKPQKSVEDYFIENMYVDKKEAQKMAENGVDLRVSKDTTLMGIVGNLYYYGFIDNEKSFNDLLEKSPDTTPGREGAIRAGENTIDINSNYYINYSMTDEEIADTLLNKGRYDENFTRYHYLFMPSGPGEGPSQRPER